MGTDDTKKTTDGTEEEETQTRETLSAKMRRLAAVNLGIASIFLGIKYKTPSLGKGSGQEPKETPYDPLISLEPARQSENDLFLKGFDLTPSERDALRVGSRNIGELCQKPRLDGENPGQEGFILWNKETRRGENYPIDYSLSLTPNGEIHRILYGLGKINKPLGTKGADRPNQELGKFTSLEQMLADIELDMASPDLRIAHDEANRGGNNACIIEYRTREMMINLPQKWQRASTSQIVRTFERYDMTPDLSARAVVGISTEVPIESHELYSNQSTIRGVFLYDAKERYIGFALRREKDLGSDDNKINPITPLISENPLKIKSNGYDTSRLNQFEFLGDRKTSKPAPGDTRYSGSDCHPVDLPSPFDKRLGTTDRPTQNFYRKGEEPFDVLLRLAASGINPNPELFGSQRHLPTHDLGKLGFGLNPSISHKENFEPYIPLKQDEDITYLIHSLTLDNPSMLDQHFKDLTAPDLRRADPANPEAGLEYRLRNQFGLPETWMTASPSQVVTDFSGYNLHIDVQVKAKTGIRSSATCGKGPYSVSVEYVLIFDKQDKYIAMALPRTDNKSILKP